MSQPDTYDETDAPVTRNVETDVAEAIALRGVGHEGSSFEREMEAQPFVGEMSRDCERCATTGAIPLSKETQESWKKELARLRLAVVETRADRTKSVEELEKAEKALDSGIEQYLAACRCPDCHGFGRTTPKGITRQRVECDQCGGKGRDSGTRLCPKCGGGKDISLGIPDTCWTTVRCWRCRGIGEVLDDEFSPVCICPLCKGKTYTVPVTVRETGCSKKGRLPFGYTPADDDYGGGSAAGAVSVPLDFTVPDEDALHRLIEAREALEKARETDPEAIGALEDFLGPVGDHYAKRTTLGRGHAVWLRTRGGKALVAIATRMQGPPARPLVALAAMREAEAASGDIKYVPWQRHMRSAVQESDGLIKRARAAIRAVLEGASA